MVATTDLMRRVMKKPRPAAASAARIAMMTTVRLLPEAEPAAALAWLCAWATTVSLSLCSFWSTSLLVGISWPV